VNFPLGIWDISLLLAITAIILLITSEMLSQYYGKINIRINRRKLRNTSIAASIVFLVTFILKIIQLVTS
jgi:hypothetical protein